MRGLLTSTKQAGVMLGDHFRTQEGLHTLPLRGRVPHEVLSEVLTELLIREYGRISIMPTPNIDA